MTPGRVFLLITTGWLILAVIFIVGFGEWRDTWGSTQAEIGMPLPGDSLIEEPTARTTRAITINAPREKIWPWIVQIGQRRGGFYTHTAFEDIFRLKIRNAWKIVPEWQNRKVGDLVYLAPESEGLMKVVELIPDSALVLVSADPVSGELSLPETGVDWCFVWALTVHPGPHPGTSRLVTRETFFSRDERRILGNLFGVASWVMESGTLKGIKIRAELLGATLAKEAARH